MSLKLDQRVIQILKNFSTINPSILIKPGNTLSTLSPVKSIMAKAKTTVNFEKEFAIYDLSRFLSAISLMEDPSLEVMDSFIVIKSGSNTINYTLTDPSLIVTAPDEIKNNFTKSISFSLTNDNISSVIRGMSVLKLPEIAINGNGSVIKLQAVDSKNPSGDVFSMELGETAENFNTIIKSENLKLLPGDYSVTITNRLVKFESDELTYWVAVEANSTI